MNKLQSKKIFNQETGIKQASIIAGNTDGIIDFVNPRYKWAINLWDLMEANTWFPGEVGVGQDKIKFNNMSDEKKETFELVLAQLIANDSIQTNQLMDGINRYITSPEVNAIIAHQSMEEARHSKSYAVMAEELLDGATAKEVYEKHKYNDELKRKNAAVADMYSLIYDTDTPTANDILIVASANNILEKMVFPGGFVVIWSMGDELINCASMISFIERDEDTHVALFKNIYASIVREHFGNIDNVPEKTKEVIYKMVDTMYNAEIRWLKYISEDLLGFSDRVIEQYIGDKANTVLKNCMLKPIYKDTNNGGILKSIENKYSMVSGNKKTNFFERTVGDYSTGALEMDI